MGGVNPYIQTPSLEKPKKEFQITFLPENKMVNISPEQMPQSGTGLPGSILDIALACDTDIDHACGGVCACSTCHIIVKKGLSSCSPSTEDEEDQLDEAPGITPQSRLACQCIPDGSEDLVIEVPNWNRNLARES